MYKALRPLFFSLPAETSHYAALKAFSLANSLHLSSLIAGEKVHKPVTVMGIEFPNSVGLAAGLDKDGLYVDAMASLGFGFLEVGTVTPKAQSGNEKPRLFRLPKEQAIINRMGFNNAGVDALVKAVEQSNFYQQKGVLGINIGKNKDTPADKAVDDYLYCMKQVYSFASYITVNLSSPNTPGLRDLQFGDPLKKLVDELVAQQQRLTSRYGKKVPLVVKIAPDMSDEDVAAIANLLKDHGINGVIATNTTIDKTVVAHLPHGNEAGGLSGLPVRNRSTEVIRILAGELGNDIPIIGVGGIFSGQDAQEKIAAGASLVQLYSGLIYQGPKLVSEVAGAL